MKLRSLLVCATTFLNVYYVHGHCIDIHSHIVSQGLHYVPGTNPCTLCICDKGSPKWCKSVLCSPPQNCKSFEVGSSCCEFKCLDDILSGHESYKETYDVAIRFIASTVTAVLTIAVLFFLYQRLKRNNILAHHNHQREDQRTLSNVGYIAGNFGYTQHNLGYLGTNNNELEIRYEETNTNFSLWKPPGNYFPSGEAPPPYEEAMRTTQNEIVTNQINNSASNLISTFSASYPQEINPMVVCRHEESTSIPNISSNTHQYVNIRVQNPKTEVNKKIERRETAEASYENIKVLKAAINEINRPTSSGFIKHAYHKSRSRESANTSKINYDKSNAVQYKVRPVDHQSEKRSDQKKILHRTLPKNLRDLLINVEKHDSIKLESLENSINVMSSNVQTISPDLGKLRDQKNLISYQSLSQDEEDYRSECENCKSVISTMPDDEIDAMNETMSLQRRPPDTAYDKCYRTSLTLPSNTKKQRTSYPNPTNREKWFSSMQQSSSEESD
ncbi:PREDICTED: uncharacterized protein LOC108562361 isoform X2 [Nicrophorus vespilloides]|uniref:Uncharacterized protein LOC108562361 isoform X2 n=1 Tax=Nicrophorus vespilloides TaxID=110193 RepID=A0ABM1MNK2_NICVS|nr:PREDICTED: uncharacterized protein LOC108562361 isoform X2 [Nicrophorus vespilloides]